MAVTEPDRQPALLESGFIERLERLELNAGKILRGEHRGDSEAARRGSGTLFREHRSYVPGDDLRFIDWNAFLRLGDLVVKEFQAEEAPRLMLFLDRSASMGLPAARFLMARRLCAALGYIGLCRHATVGCVPFPATDRRPLFRARGAVAQLLKFLSELECSGETHLVREFQKACPPGRPTGLAVVLSDFYETAEHRLALRFLRRRGFVVHALHLVDPLDLAPGRGGLLQLQDIETGRSLRERITPSLSRAYHAAVEQHFRGVERSCHELEVAYFRVSTAESIENTVLTLLRRGTLIR